MKKRNATGYRFSFGHSHGHFECRVTLSLALGVLLGGSACGNSSTAASGSGSGGSFGSGGGNTQMSAGAAGMVAAAGAGPSSSGGAGAGGGVQTPGGSGGATAGSAGATSPGGSGGGAGAGGASGGGPMDPGSGGAAGAGDCTRALLEATRDAYFKAMGAHDASTLSTTSNVKFTENGKEAKLGDGLWKTAGAVKFERSALDTESCTSVTESVVTEGSTDIVFGLRLKQAAEKISEAESIVVRQGDYFSNPSALASSASDDWTTVLAADARPTKDALAKIVDVYFKQFPAGACNFASDCKRLENGFSPGSCTAGLSCSTSNSPGSAAMTPRLYAYDLEAGIAVGFVMFAGTYTDFHMFKVRGGEVHGVHATLAKASSSGW